MLIQAAKSWLWGGNQAGLLLLEWAKSTVQHLWAAMVIENAYQQPGRIPIYSQFDHLKSDTCIIGLVWISHSPSLQSQDFEEKDRRLGEQLPSLSEGRRGSTFKRSVWKTFWWESFSGTGTATRHGGDDAFGSWEGTVRGFAGCKDPIAWYTAYLPFLVNIINIILFFLLQKAS